MGVGTERPQRGAGSAMLWGIVAAVWSDLTGWLGFWPSVVLCWTVLSFPVSCLIGQVIKEGN